MPVSALGPALLVPVLGFVFGAGMSVALGRGDAGLATAGVASGAVLIGCGGCLAAVRPWVRRGASRLPMLLFGAQGASLFVTGGIAGAAGWRLLYSAALLDVPVLLVVLPLAWTVFWVVVARLTASAMARPAAGVGGGGGAAERGEVTDPGRV